jgi:hypothetical protein
MSVDMVSMRLLDMIGRNDQIPLVRMRGWYAPGARFRLAYHRHNVVEPGHRYVDGHRILSRHWRARLLSVDQGEIPLTPPDASSMRANHFTWQDPGISAANSSEVPGSTLASD